MAVDPSPAALCGRAAALSHSDGAASRAAYRRAVESEDLEWAQYAALMLAATRRASRLTSATCRLPQPPACVDEVDSDALLPVNGTLPEMMRTMPQLPAFADHDGNGVMDQHVPEGGHMTYLGGTPGPLLPAVNLCYGCGPGGAVSW